MADQEKPKDAPKPGFLETPVVCPINGGKTTALIPISRAQHFQKYGPGHKFYELLGLVRETLLDPDAYFPYKDDDFTGYCFTRAAGYAVKNDGTRVDPPVGMVFAVFMSAGLKVTDWGWEHEDESERYRLKVHVNRLERAIWSRATK